MALTPPPEIPLITDKTTFAARAQAWVVWQAQSLYTFLVDAGGLLSLSTSATSTTSNTIGTGSKSFTVETGKGFIAGQSLTIARTSAPTNRMFAVITSYNSGTGALVVDSQGVEGSGTFTDWSITLGFNSGVSTASIQNQTATYAVSAGSSTVHTVALTPTATTKTNLRFMMKVGIAPTGSPTLNVNSLGASNWKYYDSTGAKQFVTTTQVPLNHLSDTIYDGTDYVTLNPLVPSRRLGTVQTTTSGTSKDFTGIPSWVTKITINFVGVSTNGTSLLRVQIGDSGGIETTGYLGSSSILLTGVATASSTSGFDVNDNSQAATDIRHGSITLNLVDPSINSWVISGVVCLSDSAKTMTIAGSKALSSTLDRVRITTVNGTNTFDAGYWNIAY
jgi:hypothetical protein